MDVKPEAIIRYADFQVNWSDLIAPLRKGRYTVESTQRRSIHGDSPKSFVRIKEFVPGHANSRIRRWPGYIAKVGSKRYPIESITEHLLTRIGQTFGAVIAESQLRIVAGQVRFLSKYFLSPKESLIHGLEIFRRHLDDEMVDQIAQGKREREFYTFQTVVAAVSEVYPDHQETLLRGMVEMLAFDAIVGNNDRHPLNWGVVAPVTKRGKVRFAPIFDSARGMFWNLDDSQLHKFVDNPISMNAYTRKSRPQIAWDGRQNINHFDLIRAIYAEYPEYRENLRKFADSQKILLCGNMVSGEFGLLTSDIRRRVVLRVHSPAPRAILRRTCLTEKAKGMRRSESIWRRVKRTWRDPKKIDEKIAPLGVRAEFDLFYNSQAIGMLTLAEGQWTFRYSDDFKRDGNLRTITEFPDVGKTYVSGDLWPFFLMRIPSLRQAAIKAVVDREHIDEHDEAELLRRFGRRTIANPFELLPRQCLTEPSSPSLAG